MMNCSEDKLCCVEKFYLLNATFLKKIDMTQLGRMSACPYDNLIIKIMVNQGVVQNQTVFYSKNKFC